MERDLDLILKILQWRESHQTDAYLTHERPEAAAVGKWLYHFQICAQAGFFALQEASGSIEVSAADATGLFRVKIGPLTWKGHEELERLRSTRL